MALTPKPTGNVVNYYSGNSPQVYNNSTGKWVGLSIINDDNTDLTFTINNITITVQPNEEFSDNFEDFNSITINTNTSYRLVLRG